MTDLDGRTNFVQRNNECFYQFKVTFKMNHIEDVSYLLEQ